MKKSDPARSSRYSAGGPENEYVDAAKTVLKNKQGIADLRTLHVEEERALARAYKSLLGEVRSDTPITAEFIRHVHGVIFGDLYEWAGRWRTVTISKPDVTWPPPDYLDDAMKSFEREVLVRYSADALATDKDFCVALGHIQGEFLAIHPFREGNARTIKLVTDLCAAQTKRPILRYDMSPKGKRQYINAAKAALLKKDYRLMNRIMRESLNRAIKLRVP